MFTSLRGFVLFVVPSFMENLSPPFLSQTERFQVSSPRANDSPFLAFKSALQRISRPIAPFPTPIMMFEEDPRPGRRAFPLPTDIIFGPSLSFTCCTGEARYRHAAGFFFFLQPSLVWPPITLLHSEDEWYSSWFTWNGVCVLLSCFDFPPGVPREYHVSPIL